MLEWKKLSVDDKPYRKFEKQTFFSNLFLALRAHTFLELVTKNFYWDGFHAKKDLLVNDRVNLTGKENQCWSKLLEFGFIL